MHYLKLTAVGFVCALSGAVVATPGNLPHDANLNTFEELAPALDAEGVGVIQSTKTKHNPETTDTRELVAQEAQEPVGYGVTVTVTSTPESCTTASANGFLSSNGTVQSEAVQVSSRSATEAYITAFPTGYGISIIPGPPVKVPGNSAVSNVVIQGAATTSGKIQFPGTNTTVSTSSLSPTKSGPSTSVPTAGAIKDSSAGLLLTVFLAIFGNFLVF